jgi:nitroreductase
MFRLSGGEPSMEALDVLKTRRCVRKFTRDPVDEAIISDIVDCARLAPTAINIQPWEFVVVRDPDKLRQIGRTTDHGGFIADAPLCIVVLCRDTKYYLEDGSAATQNILLAAEAHSLGSCWVAGDKKPYAERICELVDSPEGYKLVSLVPIGVPAEKPTKSKRPLKQMLHWESF